MDRPPQAASSAMQISKHPYLMEARYRICESGCKRLTQRRQRKDAKNKHNAKRQWRNGAKNKNLEPATWNIQWVSNFPSNFPMSGRKDIYVLHSEICYLSPATCHLNPGTCHLNPVSWIRQNDADKKVPKSVAVE
jgi:hypothetical protein